MILDVKNLSVTYCTTKGYTEALKEVNFSVKEGEILGIVGESGSGKSTFSYATLGLLPFDSEVKGKVMFSGKNNISLSDKELEKIRANKIALIFQDPASSFNPVLSIGYQFQEVLKQKLRIKNKAKIKKIIFNAFDKVKLPDAERIIKSYPHELSGGQLQRVAIAISISLGANLLIADEPTSSLDVTIESQIVHLFRRLRDELKLTIIFITHNLDLVKVLCDRVVVLYEGQVREIANKDDLFNLPKDSYTKDLLTSFKKLEDE